MKTKTFILRGAVLAIVSILPQVHAEPRMPMPSMPEFVRSSFTERFDEHYHAQAREVEIDVNGYGKLVESWSGYALQRAGEVVPFVIGGIQNGRTNLFPSGAVRLWVKPYWSSATTGEGQGPGHVAQVLELSVVGNSQSASVWSLRVNASGSVISLVGENGVLLNVDIAWRAGEWHQLVLNYGEKGTALVLDGGFVAEGAGTLVVPTHVAALTVGSSLAGTESFEGDIEDVYYFVRPLKMGFHYLPNKDLAARGPISAEEMAYRAELAAKWKPAKALKDKQAEESGGGEMMMRMMGFTSECVTNLPLYITNTACEFVTNQGWTVTFDVQGTNGPVDIFTTTNLVGNNITNSQWVLLESGPSCATYQYTNQPDARTFYILGSQQNSDSDSLTDAFELLMSKTLISTNDSDSDLMSDDWEVAHGLNPLVNDAYDDPDADGLTNYQEYLAVSDPQSGTMVVAWGRNFGGQCNVPAGLRDVLAVAGGERSSFALKKNGTVVAWGGNAMGETNAPATLTNASAITANGYAMCSTPTGLGLALSNGTVLQWGTTLGTPPSGLNEVRALAAGAFHCLALRSNGTVVSWGNTNQWGARLPSGLANVKAIATGWHHGVALLSNGTVNAWGLSVPQLGYTLTNVPSGLTNVAAISAYGLHTVALCSNGTVVAWGYNQCGQTNVPSGLSNVTAVATGAGHNLALKNDGTVTTWGFIAGTPESLDKVTAIASG
jgi:alpha-tubulin suppressor-like RCC1 family protein